MVLQLFVNGPPGSGKTTLAKMLCEEFNLEFVATGELLRENMKMQTTAGRRAQRCIAANKLVPDRVVLDMMEAKVASCTARGRTGWVLDSFPRTTDQAKSLIAKPHLCPAVVILLELSQEDCTGRITGRLFDPVTGAIFHSPNSLPQDPVVRARLSRRRDDTSECLEPRFEAYRTFGEATNEIFVSCQAVVHRIDASIPSAACVENVSALLHSLVTKPQKRFPFCSSNNNNQENNNQAQSTDNKKAVHPQRPQTIHETPDKDDDMQRYQYDWEDDNSTVLPLPVLSSKLGTSTERKSLPPPPTPPRVPMLRPLPTPTDRLKTLQGSSEAVNSPIQSVIVRDSTSVRSSSGSSVQSNMSITSVETAAASVDMDTFKELLLDGFEAVKHGRRGRPHPRLIFTDLEFKRVFWQKAMGPADRVGKGKHARLEQSIVVGDVIQVARGMKTDVLKRSGNVARYECYVSLVTPRRTLDLELPTPQLADFLQRGFEQLLHL
ncbi:adenylate kinase, putative [Phytophthora infestans T30-4]|uniref:Adenylate kinase, putative n=1 Tax=Phytophthora infestans (strain T30-4) TaxID=403677 RepID=D0P1X9_PHYIT|nr:adenylate kinase, putative [Phytophthora infestans T30-4]EEY55117.1 adenylate kinase, putative [Phytophthora infestans T30-4]|eukprot:XP_002895690.1 adenylate kinase, putative [Phytophthora infestans T30-4]